MLLVSRRSALTKTMWLAVANRTTDILNAISTITIPCDASKPLKDKPKKAHKKRRKLARARAQAFTVASSSIREYPKYNLDNTLRNCVPKITKAVPPYAKIERMKPIALVGAGRMRVVKISSTQQPISIKLR